METDYTPKALRKKLSVAEIGREFSALHGLLGADLSRRNNIALIEDDKMMFCSGNAVVTKNIFSNEMSVLLGIDEGGVGCIAIHPTRKYFAVGGKGYQPKIYVYSYPEIEIVKVLADGAEKGYASLHFNAPGDKLASVSTSPDFLLTVWNWEMEKINLHSKAFGQDVFTVRFSLDDERRLTTCGTGHIRFWKMAATFTGLKLQGSIGKFGKVELSDVAAFVELPDGKVVSGTEVGSLLLWEGHFIKCRFTQVGGKLCHEGEIRYLDLDRKENCLITAAADGYIRWWDYEAIDVAEVDTDITMDYELFPVCEYFIGADNGIHTLLDSGTIDGNRYFIIIDTNGVTQRLNFPLPANGKLSDTVQAMTEEGQAETTKMNTFHAGGITGMDICPKRHIVATCGDDGNIICWNYSNKSILAMTSGYTKASSLKWVPSSLESCEYSFMVGFSDGTLRLFSLQTAPPLVNDDPLDFEERMPELSHILVRKLVLKPHTEPILDIAFSEKHELMATCAKDGNVFCLRYIPKPKLLTAGTLHDFWVPLRYVCVGKCLSSNSIEGEEALPEARGSNDAICEKIDFKPEAETPLLLCSCNDGVLRELNLTTLMDVKNDGATDVEVETFETTVTSRSFCPKVMQLNTSASVAAAPAVVPNSSSDDGTAPVKEKEATTTTTTSTTVQMKVSRGLYHSTEKKMDYDGDFFVAMYSGANISVTSNKSSLASCVWTEEFPLKEMKMGLYSSDGKEMSKNPHPTCISYSQSKKFVLVGTSDGCVLVRPTACTETFIRIVAHNGDVTSVCTSFDDNYVISSGLDGTLAIHQLDIEGIDEACEPLGKDLAAGVYGDTLAKPEDDRKKKSLEPRYLVQISATDSLLDFGFPEVACPPNDMMTKVEGVTPTRFKKQTVDVDDLEPGAFSIQDAKLKMKELAKNLSADDKKEAVRGQIRLLQEDFEAVLLHNNSLPVDVRLPVEDIVVDEEYAGVLHDKGVAMVEEVHKDCAFEMEKAEKLRKKLMARLMVGVLVEKMPLYGFDEYNPNVVYSLRTRGTDPELRDILSAVHAQVRDEELGEAKVKAIQAAQKNANQAMDEMYDRLQKKEEDARVSKGAGYVNVSNGEMTMEGNKESNTSAAARRDLRHKRKARLAEHTLQKPDENEDDVRDVKAIEEAERSIGNYKMKVDSDYEVPENLRTNVQKKRRQMAMLEESMVTMRLRFNERFLAMRELKQQLVLATKKDKHRLLSIDSELAGDESFQTVPVNMFIPVAIPAEFPDDREYVTKGELDTYKKTRVDSGKTWKEASAPMNSKMTGTKTIVTTNIHTGRYKTEQKDVDSIVFSSELSPEDSAEVTEDNTVGDVMLDKFVSNHQRPGANSLKKLADLDNQIPILMAAKSSIKKLASKKIKPCLTAQNVPLNENLMRRKADRQRQLELEKKALVKKTNDNIEAFEEALEELRVDRHVIISDLKLAELKLLVLYQEYGLLQTFEARDLALQQKQQRCQKEKSEVQTNTADSQSKLQAKLEEVKQLEDEATSILAKLRAALPDTHPYAEQLGKIFKKKIKRMKIGDDDEEEEYEEEDEDEDDDDDDDDGEIEDTCPPGCDVRLYETVIDIREKRAIVEEKLVDMLKNIEDVKKTIERMKQREKQIDKDFRQTEAEIQQFQLQKQGSLNQIDIVVPLNVSQLYTFESSGALSGPEQVDANAQPAAMIEGESLAESATKLRDIERRMLINEIGSKSHILFSERSLQRLQSRIGELQQEGNDARINFRELHKERVRLEKERDAVKAQIEILTDRCNNLQMLKFGRVIDIDELEAGSDRTKENEAELGVKAVEEKHSSIVSTLNKEGAVLKDKLGKTTTRNTELLKLVAELTESKISVTKELNSSSGGGAAAAAQDLSSSQIRKDAAEKKRVATYVALQRREIDALKMELLLLKRKEAPPVQMPQASFDRSIPLPPIQANSSYSLPPTGGDGKK